MSPNSNSTQKKKQQIHTKYMELIWEIEIFLSLRYMQKEMLVTMPDHTIALNVSDAT